MDNPQVTIEQGTLRGITGTDLNGKEYYSFFGIPYARPPIGTLRFKAPQPPENWSGVRDATADTGECYSRGDFFRLGHVGGSEDCLVLNVYTPELPERESVLKPVMVWIHGGAWLWGSNDSKTYGPQYLITEDVVIVAINYRLGFLGLLAMEDPKLGVPGNAAFKDMVMALKWVQKNVKYFGGDPNNVTIFGESAGAASVHLLILSPMAEGLFHKAIIQSGSALCPWAVGRSSAKELAQALNCSFTDETDILTFLQSLSYEEIYNGQASLADPLKTNYIRPIGLVIEKITPNEPAFLSENPLDIILKGNYNKVPIMIGYNNMEATMYELFKDPKKCFVEDMEDLILPSLKLVRGSAESKIVANKIKSFYFGNEDPSLENIMAQYTAQTDSFFAYGIQQSAKYHALTSQEPIYLYRFSYEGNLNFLKIIGNIKYPGASHADELGYLFKSFITPEKLSADDIKDIKRMVKIWTNFAKTGNPNPLNGVIWEPVTKEKLNFLDIDEKLVASVDPDKERMEFWDNIAK